VFVALADTIREFEIPLQPWRDLLTAFRQDQHVARYDTFDALLGYCRNSANPVGRLVLYLARCPTPEKIAWSDSICTGLQLANFWQDVAGDWDRGRIYVPRESLERFGYDETSFARRDCGLGFRRMLAGEVDRAETFLLAGLPLVPTVPRELRVDIELFIRGGQAILERIRAVDFDVWSCRPRVSRWQQLRLLGGCLWRAWRGR
jgi:squalene synthase HpnC